MKVYITGATGWLGSRFVEIILKDSKYGTETSTWEITCLVLPGEDTTALEKLRQGNKLNIVYGDITKIDTLSGHLVDVDLVFHTAGLIHPKNINELYSVNTLGTENLLKEAKKSGVKKFIYISSNSVAGFNISKKTPFDEKTPDNPYLNYGLSKYYAEQSVKKHHRSGILDTVILRPCWFYGPNQPTRQTTFFKMIQKGNPIIFGDGHNLRSLSYVDNTCQAMLLAATSEKSSGQTYWISDEKPYETIEIYKTIADLLSVKDFAPRNLPNFVSWGCAVADTIMQKLGLYIKEIHVAGEMNKNIFCSNEKAIKELGYKPKVALKEGMSNSIKWSKDKGQL